MKLYEDENIVITVKDTEYDASTEEVASETETQTQTEVVQNSDTSKEDDMMSILGIALIGALLVSVVCALAYNSDGGYDRMY